MLFIVDKQGVVRYVDIHDIDHQPDNDVLLVWTPGPANNLLRPTPIPYYDGGIYLLPGGVPAEEPDGRKA